MKKKQPAFRQLLAAQLMVPNMDEAALSQIRWKCLGLESNSRPIGMKPSIFLFSHHTTFTQDHWYRSQLQTSRHKCNVVFQISIQALLCVVSQDLTRLEHGLNHNHVNSDVGSYVNNWIEAEILQTRGFILHVWHWLWSCQPSLPYILSR